MSPIHFMQFMSIDVKPQRLLAAVLMLFLHAGLILSLSQGLDWRSSSPGVDSSRVRVIELPVLVPPTNPLQPVVVGSIRSMTKTVEPIVEPIVIETATRTDAQPQARHDDATVASNADPVSVLAARIDPRHPLIQPAYPATSRRLGEEGTVELSVYVLTDGRIGDVRIERSSGFVRLDEAAAREALRTWRLLPGRLNDAPVAGWHRIAVTFHLQN